MIIDNFDKVRKYLVFDRDNDPDLFYYVQIIQRRKDEGVTIKKNCKTIRSYYVTSLRYWDDHIEQIKELCKTFKARAYIHLVPRSWRKCTLMAFGELATYLRSNQCSSLRKLTEEMAGKYIADGVQKLWIIDVDTKDQDVVNEVSATVNDCKPNGDKIIDFIPTKNGYHIITKPFDLSEFRIYYSEKELDIHKNNPTLLYYEN